MERNVLKSLNIEWLDYSTFGIDQLHIPSQHLQNHIWGHLEYDQTWTNFEHIQAIRWCKPNPKGFNITQHVQIGICNYDCYMVFKHTHHHAFVLRKISFCKGQHWNPPCLHIFQDFECLQLQKLNKFAYFQMVFQVMWIKVVHKLK
jgi:hypothetical protein